jgi:hypothetical protein
MGGFDVVRWLDCLGGGYGNNYRCPQNENGRLAGDILKGLF